MYVIEKNIPLPQPAIKHSPVRVTMESMQVGDSIFIPASQQDYNKVQSRISANYVLLKPKIFTIRKIENGMRLWRIR